MNPRKRWFAAAGTACALALTTVGFTTGAEGVSTPTAAGDTEAIPKDAFVNDFNEWEEASEFRPMKSEVGDLLQDLSDDFGSDPRFSGLRIDRAQTLVTVWWHGDATPALRTATEAATIIDVEVASTKLPPKLLRAARDRIIGHPAYRDAITSVGFPLDASQLTVTVDGGLTGTGQQYRPDLPELQDELESLVGVPVSVDVMGVTASRSRQFDTYGIGGAHYVDPQSRKSCSTGFPVTHLDGRLGLLTAAHCGPVGSKWGPRDSTRHISYGSITERFEEHDMAVIEMRSGGAAVYVGGHEATSVTRINGVRSVVEGEPLCYSGSFSGTSCGNYVTQLNTKWNAGMSRDSIGFRTGRDDWEPVVGQGDSGGPTVRAETNPDGTQSVYAVGTISAIGEPVSRGNCYGLRREDPLRVCSSVVFNGSAMTFNQTSRWNIKRQ